MSVVQWFDVLVVFNKSNYFVSVSIPKLCDIQNLYSKLNFIALMHLCTFYMGHLLISLHQIMIRISLRLGTDIEKPQSRINLTYIGFCKQFKLDKSRIKHVCPLVEEHASCLQ